MNKLNGIKKGDAVEVTFRGRVDGLGPRTLDVIMDGADDPNILCANAIAAPSFSITKVEPPIAVGEMVAVRGQDDRLYELLAIRGDSVALWGPFYESGPSGMATAHGAFLEDVRRP